MFVTAHLFQCLQQRSIDTLPQVEYFRDEFITGNYVRLFSREIGGSNGRAGTGRCYIRWSGRRVEFSGVR
jgi:hypothetical protein